MIALPISKGFYNWRNMKEDNINFIKNIMNTLYRCVLEYIEVLRFFNKWSGKRREDVLRLLGRMLNKDISISEDYKVKGENLDYINEQKLKSQIIRTIEYWSNPHTEC